MSENIIVNLSNGTHQVSIDTFTSEHTVMQLIEYAIDNKLIKWPKDSGESKGYSIDGETSKIYALGEEEELGENCSLDPDDPSTITLEAETIVGLGEKNPGVVLVDCRLFS